jgi:hypothetical protein
MVGLLWTSDQPVAETSTCTGQHNIQTSMPRVGFEPATPATKQPQTYALDRAATGISWKYLHFGFNCPSLCSRELAQFLHITVLTRSV